MKTIPLTRGQVALVDDEDFALFGHLKWYAHLDPKSKSFYAARHSPRQNRRVLWLAREILGLTDPSIKGDHINHDTLDCRRHNLRISTSSQNGSNRLGTQSNSTSGYRGVSWNKRDHRWQATITVKGKSIHLGNFTDKIMAADAYAAANRKHFGDFGGSL